jgi:hypothetical protein
MKKIVKSDEDKLIRELEEKNLKKNRGELYHVWKMNIDKLVHKYLMIGKVTYLLRINGYDALSSLGYDRPKYDSVAKIEFDKKVSEFARALKSKLVELGFKADRENKNYNVQNTETDHVPKCTVYTNLPSTVYYKAMRAVKHAEDTMRIEHDRSIELDEYERFDPLSARLGRVLLSEKANRAEVFADGNSGIREAFADFRNAREDSSNEEFEYFKNRTTKKYKEYIENKKDK